MSVYEFEYNWITLSAATSPGSRRTSKHIILAFHPEKMLEVTTEVKNVRVGSFFTPQIGILTKL